MKLYIYCGFIDVFIARVANIYAAAVPVMYCNVLQTLTIRAKYPPVFECMIYLSITFDRLNILSQYRIDPRLVSII